MFKTPNFWKKKGILSFIFLPISYLYYLGHIFNSKFRKEITIDIPVICVGNLVVGGSGKTPLVIKIREILSKKYKKIFVLTRGYGGVKKGPLIVNKTYKYEEVGDESLLHHQHGNTCMSKNKIYGGLFCVKNGADLLILDDGLQSINLKKNVSILVVDLNYKFGNRRIFPAGPLREKIGNVNKKYEIIVCIGKSKKKFDEINVDDNKVFYAEKSIILKELKNKKILAFSGLGNNLNFLNLLKKQKLEIVRFLQFPDHHNYSIKEIKNILKIANKEKLSVVTTEKDYLKIPSSLQIKINVAKLSIKIENEKKFLELLLGGLF